MTREGDQEVSLGDRVALANDRKVDLLISIHNNALPDGRDPVKEHGTSSYWYHKQSKELARALKNGLVKEVGLPDTGDRFQNLALCRPSAMQAVLMEVGYVVNPDEYAKLIDPAFQEKAARGLLSGLYNYLGVTK
jgi:N-acetylmuramoyl-L-alanine amidase